MKMNTNRIIGLYATQDYGKTYMINFLISKIPKDVKIFLFDTNYEAESKYKSPNQNLFKVTSKKPSAQETPEFLNDTILMLRSKYSNFFLVIEDIDKIIDTPAKQKRLKEIFNLTSDSRHQRIGIIYASKEPTNIPVKLRTTTNLFFIGNFTEPAHLKYISQMVNKRIIENLVKPQFFMLDRLASDKKDMRHIVVVNNDKLYIVGEDENKQDGE